MAKRRKLSPEEKTERARQRMLEKAKELQVGTYVRRVAKVFQRMIRAEWAAKPVCYEFAVVDGAIAGTFRRQGQCVCVTCGLIGPWSSGIGGMHTGHFLGSRRNSILFEEDNVAPQCSKCNRYRSGAPQEFRQWMLAVRGEDCVERLERLKTMSRQFSLDELVDMRIAFQARLRDAEARMRMGETT